jgi:hypothetical protein
MLKVELNASPKGHRLVSTEAIRERGLVYKICGHRLLAKPTYKSVQIDLEIHIEENECLGYLNHSCDPNVWVNASTLECIALRDIQPHEELNMFYPSTEWEMIRPFTCHCGTAGCLRLIAGAKYLALDTLSQYAVNLHIRRAALKCLSGDGPLAEPIARWSQLGIAVAGGV